MTLFDTHCHLFMMDADPASAVAEAREAGVDGLVCVGIDAASSRASRELADSLPGVFATAGVHPHSASEFDAAAGSAVEELLQDPRVVGVGETGLDYFRLLSPVEEQQRAFRVHCGLGRDSDKPLIVHARDAWDDVLRILEEERAERVVLHCFSGDATTAREATARGYFCSFAGVVTYPKNGHLLEAAAAVPPELLLVETDSPFLPPQSMRGRDNAPANVRHVVEAIASSRGVEAAEIAALTSANARRAFDLPS
jgi:TatD DNase family protein